MEIKHEILGPNWLKIMIFIHFDLQLNEIRDKMVDEHAILFKMVIFMRNAAESILNLKIHQIKLYIVKLPHSINVVKQSNIVNHSRKVYLLPKVPGEIVDLRLMFLLPIHESVENA